LTALLSLAFWKTKAVAWLGGVAAQAIAVIVAVVLVAGGLWWLRADARDDERALCDAENLVAENTALRAMQKRVTAAEKIAAEYRALIAAGNMAARTRIGELEATLARKPRNVCYSAEVARRLAQ
jgi:hypothetical protein